MRIRAARRSCIMLLALAALAAPGAHAGIVAAVDVPVGATTTDCPTQTDLALIDPATGARSPLPAGINTSATELHPSINTLGTRLTFARLDPSGGTTRIIIADLSTGQQADLFSFFDSVQTPPNTPSLTPDGASVLTGMPLTPTGSKFAAVETSTALSNFPAGPFPRTNVQTGAQFDHSGLTLDATQRSDGLIASAVTGQASSDVLLQPGGGAAKLGPGDHPALSDSTTNVVVFQHPSAQFGSEVLAFRPVTTFDSASTVDLPPIINPDHFDELNPAFTPDGRYLGFVRYAHGGDHHVRLFVFDTATQTLVNNSGVDLGAFPGFICETHLPWPFLGGLSLRESFVLVTSSVNLLGTSGFLSFQLLQGSAIGILVQRVIGHDRLFGHVVPTLRIVGRVPFGHFNRGRHKVNWNLRVGGHRLRRGTYLVTPRLLTGRGIVHELGKPRLVRIR